MSVFWDASECPFTTSLNILNVLLTSLCLLFSLVVFFGAFIYVLLSSNFTMAFSFLSHILGIGLLQSKRELTIKVENNLGLSLYTVPRSAVACVVAYFRKTKLLPGVQERSGILLRVRIEHVKDVNLRTKKLGCCKGDWGMRILR